MANLDSVVSVGRGGRGNMRGRAATRPETLDNELDVVPLERSRGREAVVSVGRGGFGNVSTGLVELERSRSRSQKREGLMPVYSVGRGGLGNIPGHMALREEDEKGHHGTHKPHETHGTNGTHGTHSPHRCQAEDANTPPSTAKPSLWAKAKRIFK